VAIEHGIRMSHSEGPAQVFHAFSPVVPGLRISVPDPLQGVHNPLSATATQQLGNGFRLVEFALSLPRGMKRDGYEGIKIGRPQPFVIQPSCSPLGELMPKIILPPIFESMDQVADDTPCPVATDGGEKMKSPVLAVVASKLLRDLAVKWQRTLLAIGRLDRPGFILAPLA
jgi:hypothetical protein